MKEQERESEHRQPESALRRYVYVCGLERYCTLFSQHCFLIKAFAYHVGLEIAAFSLSLCTTRLEGRPQA